MELVEDAKRFGSLDNNPHFHNITYSLADFISNLLHELVTYTELLKRCSTINKYAEIIVFTICDASEPTS